MPITPDTDTIDNAIDYVEDEAQTIEDFIADRPLLSIGIAALFGFVLAKTIL